MYIFKKVPDETNPYDSAIVQHEVESATLSTLVEEFTYFLRGCGFVVNAKEIEETIKESMIESQNAESAE